MAAGGGPAWGEHRGIQAVLLDYPARISRCSSHAGRRAPHAGIEQPFVTFVTFVATVVISVA
jgi:hypothetical protein